MHYSKLTLGLVLAFTSTQSFSAAFQLAEHSAAGLGRAFAGEAAIAEDASVVARNPALMSQFTESQFSVAGTFIAPDVSLEGQSAPEGIDPKSLDDDSIAPNAFIPAIYYVKPIDTQLAIGFGAFSNFGLASELDDDYAAGQLAGETSITTINLNASVSYQLDNHWSFGFGANAVYAEAELIRHFGETSLLPAPIKPDPTTEAANMSGDDIAFGWNAGVTYDINSNHRIGFSYRSEVDLALEGEYSNEIPGVLGGLGGAEIDGNLDLTLPAIAEFSGYHQANHAIAIHYSVMWTGWSSLDQLEAFDESGNSLFQKTENFSDAYRYAFGATVKHSENLTLRAGIAYDESPTDPDHMSISIPDNNRFWYSAGATYQLDDKSSIDFGVTYIDGKGEDFTEIDELGQEWGFHSEGNATLVSLQYNIAL